MVKRVTSVQTDTSRMSFSDIKLYDYFDASNNAHIYQKISQYDGCNTLAIHRPTGSTSIITTNLGCTVTVLDVEIRILEK